MLRFEPFKAEHLRYLAPQQAQRLEHATVLTTDYGDIMEKNFALSAWEGQVCIAAAGLVPVYSHRAVAWALFSNDAGRHLRGITRKIKGAFDISGFKRIEMTVRADFEQGKRFALLVGMTCETPEALKSYGAMGEDEFLYSRVV